MVGKSYLGTLSTAVTTTDVKGLKTCIIEAAISSWYDYYRDNGVVIGPEDCDVLAEFTFSRHQSAADYHRIKSLWHRQLRNIYHGEDRITGDYNQFWDARNYLKNVHNVKADLLIVHGLNDYNVKPRDVGNLWQKLQTVPVTKKLILHQGKHIYINDLQSLILLICATSGLAINSMGLIITLIKSSRR